LVINIVAKICLFYLGGTAPIKVMNHWLSLFNSEFLMEKGMLEAIMNIRKILKG